MDDEQHAEEIGFLKESRRTYISLETKESEVITKILPDHAHTDEDRSESEELSIDDLDSKLSLACSDAKEKINEIFNLKSSFLEQYDLMIKQEQNRYIEDLKKNSEELRKIQHLAESYQTTIHFKESIIGSLVEALQKQKDKYESCKAFYVWRTHYLDIQREKFFYAFAKKHYEDDLKQKTFRSWRAATELGWKERIENQVKVNMQEQQQHLVKDYEAKIKSLEEKLKESKENIDILQSKHKSYEDMMKQALMRGVCALNVEAMSVLYNSSETSSHPSVASLSVPHLPDYPSHGLNIPSDISSIHACPECLWCPSEVKGEKTVRCVSSSKDILPEQAVLPKTTKVHHSSTLKSIPMMGTTNAPAQVPRTGYKGPDALCCHVPTVSVQRHISRSTSSLSGGLKSSSSRDQYRKL